MYYSSYECFELGLVHVQVLFTICFYFSIFQFVAVEGILTPIKDLFPKQLYRPKSRMFLAAGYCGITFNLGLSMVTQVN